MLMKFIEKLLVLPAPWGRCRAKRGGRGRRGDCGDAINISRCNPSVCLQSSQPPSLSGKIYQTCGRLIFANLFNFYMLPYMLPARELASPQAMTEGCATSQYCRAAPQRKGGSEGVPFASANRRWISALSYKNLTCILEYF